MLAVPLALIAGLIWLLWPAPAVEGDADADISGIADPGDAFEVLSMSGEELHKGTLVEVNRSHAYTFPADQQLVSIFENKNSHYSVRDRNVLVDSRVMEPLNRLLEDFYRQSGLTTINVVAGQRSYDYQQRLYQNSIAQNGEEHTKKYVAFPGYSEHHTGLAVDLSIFYENGTTGEYDGTGPYQWINDNAFRYGFVLRYPQDKEDRTGIAYEPWHFRYVGVPHAAVMTERGLCLEEYTTYLRQFPYDGVHLKTTCDGVDYEIYYEAGSEIHVPKDRSYTVSGNNVDGFIVAVQK